MPYFIKFTDTTHCDQQAHIIPNATAKSDGVMSKEDKKKLDSLSSSGKLVQDAFVEVTTDETTDSAVFVDLLTLGITTKAGFLAIWASYAAMVISSEIPGSNNFTFRLLLDGTPIRAAAESAIIGEQGSGCIINRLPVTVGLHTVKLQWRAILPCTIGVRPLTQVDTEHASLYVQEIAA